MNGSSFVDGASLGMKESVAAASSSGCSAAGVSAHVSAGTPAESLGCTSRPGQARDFTAAAPDRPWVGDSTHVATTEGWPYRAGLVDAYSRRVVGWSMADHLRTTLTLDALAMALQARRPGAGLVHHTDRGSQYTAAAYQAALSARGVAVSMRRAGECRDNAMAESFFATLKAELVDTQRWPPRAAARQAIFEWLEAFYQRQRRHSALAYQSPTRFEGMLLLHDHAA